MERPSPRHLSVVDIDSGLAHSWERRAGLPAQLVSRHFRPHRPVSPDA
jgi:hypothetical protein